MIYIHWSLQLKHYQGTICQMCFFNNTTINLHIFKIFTEIFNSHSEKEIITIALIHFVVLFSVWKTVHKPTLESIKLVNDISCLRIKICKINFVIGTYPLWLWLLFLKLFTIYLGFALQLVSYYRLNLCLAYYGLLSCYAILRWVPLFYSGLAAWFNSLVYLQSVN